MASPLTPAKRFTVRAALVTGSTLSLIFGAQALMTLDLRNADVTAVNVGVDASQSETTAFNTTPSVVVIQPSTTNSVQTQPSVPFTSRRHRTHSSH